MEKETRTKDEISNDSAIPAEMKDKLAENVNKVLTHIALIENAIDNAIDNTMDEIDEPISVSEIMSAILNCAKKMNQKEIMQLIKIKQE